MKNIIYTILIFGTIFSLGCSNNVFAQSLTSAPTKSTTPTSSDSQIEKIKDLVASRVAELKLVDKRGIVGTVKNSSNNQITVTDSKNKEGVIDIDELTKFESQGKESFGISDVEKGDIVSAVGLYNKQTQRLLARFVEMAAYIPENMWGVVLDRNASEFIITIALEDGKKKVVNVDSSTKTSVFEDDETIKSGFSKIEVGERVLVVGFPDKSEADQINASRIIRLPGMALSKGLKKARDRKSVV